MKAGDLKHWITLERPATVTDGRGNRIAGWAQFAGCYASMADVSGRDFYAAQAYQVQDIVTFGIRWREDLDVTCRIVRAGQPYKIEQINHLGYKQDFLHIKARAVRGKGV